MAETDATDPGMERDLRALRAPGLLLGYRIITPGDEDALLPSERAGIERATLKIRRQSGAARIAARSLLARLGRPAAELPRLASGAPQWPDGFAGSLAHDRRFAVAAVLPSSGDVSIGIDVEPAEPLPPKLINAVATPGERARYDSRLLGSRVLFCAKEAVYKALRASAGRRVGFQDIEVRLDSGEALLENGLRARVSVVAGSRIVALARHVEPRAARPPL